MEDRAEIVSRNPLARPPLRPYEVFVTRRVPLVVYFKRCVKLLRGPYAKAVIRGTGSCIETAICVAQDVVAAFGGQGVGATGLEAPTAAEATKGKAEAVFAAAASALAALGSSSNASILSLSAETSSVQAFDEVFSLGNRNNSDKEEALEAAGIQQELSSFVRQRNISAIKIELQRMSPPPS
ncbi:hypothetical protein, conserved [Eimeria praecox]|uniref:Uncharacterized protein n=1 Tax=Eimeria praecox TaxID=51316 RepID=U6GQW5_9EIME|nr:hypothetical protein, conserved [Eimeria praecox]